MKQKTSYFNWGLCRSWLKRCWPLWLAYLALLLLLLPGALPGYFGDGNCQQAWEAVNRHVAYAGLDIVGGSVAAGLAVAMAMFSFLYNNRACGMINALPLRRETVFVTAYLTGLVPLLLADVLTGLVTWALLASNGMPTGNLLNALACAAMGNIAFYGFAVFCAMLTGNLWVLPAVYLLLNCAAALAEASVKTVLNNLIYGYVASVDVLTVFSPLVALMSHKLRVELLRPEGGGAAEAVVRGEGLLAAYCVAGLALSVCALLLYRRRSMERAGDAVAIPVLRPVFKYCMAFGGAVVFAVAVYSWVLQTVLRGPGAALAMGALLCVGAFLGYFAAEMLLQKSLSVFRRGWGGLGAVCAVCLLFTVLAETDVFGYERRVPAAEEVACVEINYDSSLRQTESIEAVTRLHRQVIGSKALNERAGDKLGFTLRYLLKDGTELSRFYEIAEGREERAQAASDLRQLEAVLNLQEAVESRLAFGSDGKLQELTELMVAHASFDGSYYDGEGNYQDVFLRLTDAQAVAFFNECVLPDLRDSSLGRVCLAQDGAYFDRMSNIGFSLDVQLETPDAQSVGTPLDDTRVVYTSIPLTLDARRCAAWIAENTDITLLSQRQADPEGVERALEEDAYLASPAKTYRRTG